MDETKQAILALIDQNGGRVEYRTVYNALSETQRRNLPKAMKSLKSEGTAMNQNRRTPEGNLVFEIFRMTPVAGGQ